MVKSVIITDHGVRIRFRQGAFIIESRNGRQTLNPVEVEQVVIATGSVWLSSKVVRKMIEYGIDLVFLDSRGKPLGRVYPPYINKTVYTRREQYLAYHDPRSEYIVKEIVYAKIANQAGLLKRYYHNTRIIELRNAYEEIREILGKIHDVNGPLKDIRDQLRQYEARAAQIYWPSYALLLPRDLGFESRDQDGDDPVNIALNYGYGILYSECWKALVLAGLDPYAGYMHVDRSGKPVLVFDFIEQFRFIVDYTLLKLFRRGWRPELVNGFIEYGSRSKIIVAINEFLDHTTTQRYGEKPLTLRQAIKKNAFQLAGFLRNEQVYRGFIWEW